MVQSSNKRKAKRVDCSVPVEGKEGGLFDGVFTVDFSKGGLGLISDRDIPINEEIAVEIDMGETQDPVLVMGKVVWTHPVNDHFRLGLAFGDVLAGARTRLNQLFK